LLTPNIIDDWVTAGATWTACVIGELSFYGAYGFQNRIFGKHSIPNDFGGGETNLRESQYCIGLSWTKYY
jgi:hypothetical protein